MRLVTYRKGSSKPRVGALVDDVVLDLGALAADLARERGTVRRGRGFPKTMLELIQGGADALALAREALAHGDAVVKRDGVAALTERKLGAPAAKVRLEAPIPRPARNVFCLGRNYKEHAAERGAEAPPHPVYFTKAPETVVAPGAKVIHHAVTKELDYEVELTVVIGTGGRDIPREQALQHVFGYTIINDVTARDLQKRHGQWFKGKSMDTFCPMGPVLVTADEIPDPQAPERGHADQRGDAAVEPHLEDDLSGRRVHRGALAGVHRAARRRHRHRHAGGRGGGARQVPEGGRQDGGRGRAHRRPRQPDRRAVTRRRSA